MVATVYGECLSVVCLLGLWLGVGGVAAAEPAEAEPARDVFAEDVRPILREYCYRCHRGRRARAKLHLDAFESRADAAKRPDIWDKVLRKVRAGKMPPRDRDQPSATERETLLAWIDGVLDDFDCTKKTDPGRVTVRRLNRAEYNNTVRDLLGIEFRPADDFPPDDSGYGFDTIGDVLSVPLLLMEKYLAAAERIADAAIVTPDAPAPHVTRLEAERFDGGDPNADERAFFSAAEAGTQHRFSDDGEYVLRIRASGDQAGPEPARMSVRLDGQELKRIDVPAKHIAPKVYELRVHVEAGERKVAVAFVNDYYRPDDPDPAKKGDRNLYVDYLEIEGPIDARAKLRELTDVHKRIMTCQPAKGAELECARKILAPLARRAFRRPVTDDEVKRLAQFIELAAAEGDSFERGIQLALQAILVSPNFLFRTEPEIDGAGAGDVLPISDLSLASRLSYFLWSSMPDEELLALAEQGKLRDTLEAQVRRMLKDPKAVALVENFAGQWLETRNLERVMPDPDRFPEFDDKLRAAMRGETESLFAHIMREDRSVLELLDSDYTFLNERLARHYGIDGVTGEAFQRVAMKDGHRGGVLTHAGILTLTSDPTRTSPVKRGKWILETLLGTPPPPPPPGVPPLAELEEGSIVASLREQLEKHRANPDCAVCHDAMDPLGFALENFDAIGAWRDLDGEAEIDASGVLPSGESFSGPQELRKLLVGKKDLFCRCVAEKMLTFALGRGIEYYDKCAVDQIAEAMAAADYRFSSLVLGVVQSVPFQMRRSSGDHE